MKKTIVAPILFLAISSALCAERNLECSSFEKNTTVMSDDVIQSLSKVVDDSLYSRWKDKNFIVDYEHWYACACACACENKYELQSKKNQNLSWIFNYCDLPDSMVVFYEDSLEYMILNKNEKLYLMIEKLKDEIDRYDSLLCDSTESIGRGLIFRGSAKSLLQK